MKTNLKDSELKLSSVVAPLALALAVSTANSTCWYYTYQPKAPAGLSKYSK